MSICGPCRRVLSSWHRLTGTGLSSSSSTLPTRTGSRSRASSRTGESEISGSLYRSTPSPIWSGNQQQFSWIMFPLASCRPPFFPCHSSCTPDWGVSKIRPGRFSPAVPTCLIPLMSLHREWSGSLGDHQVTLIIPCGTMNSSGLTGSMQMMAVVLNGPRKW